MSLYRFLLLPALVGSVLLLSGALSPPTSPSPIVPTIPVVSPQSARANAEAVKILDRVLHQLDPQHLAWLEANLWQQVHMLGLSYESEGRYLAGPDHRLRIDLKVRSEDSESSLQVVSDGSTFWQAERNGGNGWTTIKRISLKEVLASLKKEDAPQKICDEFFQSQAFGGIMALTHDLRDRMTWFAADQVRRGGRDFIMLSAVWTPEAAEALAPGAEPWPDGMARQCRLYVDSNTLLPHRLEWWGPDPPRAGEVLLLEMEWRNPVINQPPSMEKCARLFSFDPGRQEYGDYTKKVTEELQRKAAQLAQSTRNSSAALRTP